MVGKLNDMVSAAVVVDSSNKTGAINPQDFAKIKPVESQPSSASELKPLSPQEAKEAEKKEQEQEKRLEPGTMSEESVNEMTETFNELMDKINCNIEFNYNKKANVLNVKMIDKETKEVIKEFPPEEMIENMIKAKDWLGAFIDRAI